MVQRLSKSADLAFVKEWHYNYKNNNNITSNLYFHRSKISICNYNNTNKRMEIITINNIQIDKKNISLSLITNLNNSSLLCWLMSTDSADVTHPLQARQSFKVISAFFKRVCDPLSSSTFKINRWDTRYSLSYLHKKTLWPRETGQISESNIDSAIWLDKKKCLVPTIFF